SASPLNMDVIVNLTPSERLSGSTRVQDRNLGRLLPALKTFSQFKLANGSVNVELLDLTRQLVIFHQENAHGLDWPAIRSSLSDTKPGVIDIKSLEHRTESARFFVDEVARKANADSAGQRVLILLSSPVEFARGEEMPPIDASRGEELRVYYLRVHAAPVMPT